MKRRHHIHRYYPGMFFGINLAMPTIIFSMTYLRHFGIKVLENEILMVLIAMALATVAYFLGWRIYKRMEGLLVQKISPHEKAVKIAHFIDIASIFLIGFICMVIG